MHKDRSFLLWFRYGTALLTAAVLLTGITEHAYGRETGRLKVAFVGDPQVDDSTELLYARKSVYRELRERKDIDMAIFLGDIVNDSMELLEQSRESMDSLAYPYFVIPGNHDFDIYKGKKAKVRQPDRDRDLVSYSDVFGSPDTTFARNGIRFVLMNDIQYDKSSYKGGFDHAQVEYLDSAVNAGAGERLLVLVTHIPYSHIKDRAATDSVLARFNGEILLVSGHTHRVERSSVELAGGRTVQELIAGASCGTWWRGQKDESGIPYALQGCGSPRGYFIADFRKGEFTLEYKCIGRPEGFLSSAWAVPAAGDSTRLIVNIFGGSVDGIAEIRAGRLHSGKRITLEMTGDTAPEVLEAIETNKSLEGGRTKKAEMLPLRHSRSPHIWSVTVPGDIDVRRIKIRYCDQNMSFRSTVPLRRLHR